jgi:hypothetical protein
MTGDETKVYGRCRQSIDMTHESVTYETVKLKA